MQGKGRNLEFYYKILTKCGQTPLFITFEQSYLSISTLHKVICYKFCSSGSAFFKLLDSDPHWEEQLDPDLQKMNADPQPCWSGSYMHFKICKQSKIGFFSSLKTIKPQESYGNHLMDSKEWFKEHVVSVADSGPAEIFGSRSGSDTLLEVAVGTSVI